MEQDLISIIVPVYNVEKYIERCVRSVLEQTYGQLDIIFVDDCSIDQSLSILIRTVREYPERQGQVQVIRHKENKGLAAARKTGLHAALGEYVMQFDSDDYVATDIVEKLYSCAKKENADVTICDFNYVYPDRTEYRPVNPSLDNLECMKQVLTGEVHSSVCNKLIRKSLYFDNWILPTEGLDMREDLSVMYKLLYYAKKIAYLPEPLYYYVQNQGSLSSPQMNTKQQADAIKLLEQMEEFQDEIGATEDVGLYFTFFKVMVKANILLYGNLRDKSLRSGLFRRIGFSAIKNHPHLRIILKIVMLLDFFHLGQGIIGLRKLRKLKYYDQKAI